MMYLIKTIDQALSCPDDPDGLSLAITCVCNAMCSRELTTDNRQDLIRLLGEMQKKQRAIWRGH